MTVERPSCGDAWRASQVELKLAEHSAVPSKVPGPECMRGNPSFFLLFVVTHPENLWAKLGSTVVMDVGIWLVF